LNLAEESNEFLGNEEKVISSLKDDTWGLFVTNWRLIYLEKTEDDKNRTFQDFDYKYISHINCKSTKEKDNKLIGIMSLVVGLLIIWAGYDDYRTIALSLGIIFIIIGIICILYKPKLQSVFKIDIVGISDPITITLAVSASDMDLILKPLADMRRARFIHELWNNIK